MDTVKLVVQQRVETGKGPGRRLRQVGKLPAVVYGRGDSKALTVDAKELLLIRQAGGENTIIDLVINGDGGDAEECSVILRELQIDPVSRNQVHADFYRVDLNVAIIVTVPLDFVNVPEDRLKAAQSEVSILSRELSVECLPRDIPAIIEVDLDALEVGEVIYAETVVLPQGLVLMTNPEEAIVSTQAIVDLIEAEAAEALEMVVAEGDEAPAEGSAAAEAASGEETE